MFHKRLADIIKIELVLTAAKEHPHLRFFTAATKNFTAFSDNVDSGNVRTKFPELHTHLEAESLNIVRVEIVGTG
jgi:hypothetical protein